MNSSIRALLSLLLLPAAASAAPDHVRLSWCGGEAGTTMCITWNDKAGGGNQVQYGLSQTLTETATATAWTAPPPLGTVYEAELINLSPNQEYQYRVGGGGSAWSTTYTFRTGPTSQDPCVPFTFAVLGDNRSQDDSGADIKWNAILGEAVDKDPSFVLNTGDLVKDGDQPAQWEDYLEKTDPISAYYPLFPSIGNHDDDKIQGEGAIYNVLHQLPRNVSSNTEDFYHFTYGDAIFVSLTSQNYNDDGFAQQAGWLDQVLTENPRRWKFVYFHHPPYTGFADIFGLELGHPPNEKGQNAALVPIFDKHHVDVVFNGHNHWYQRFEPMAGGGGSDQGKPVASAAEGTTYVITGGAGAFTFDFDIGDFEFDPLDFICPAATGTLVCDGRHHYVTVTIDKNEASFEVWATAAQNFDTDPSNITMIDAWKITKDDPLSCVEPPDPVEPDPEMGEVVEEPVVAEPIVEEPTVAEPVVEEPAVVAEEPPVAEPAEVVEEPTVAEPTAPETDAGPAVVKPDPGPLVIDTGPGAGSGSTSTSGESDEGGCQAGPHGQSGGPLFLLALFLVLMARRFTTRRI